MHICIHAQKYGDNYVQIWLSVFPEGSITPVTSISLPACFQCRFWVSVKFVPIAARARHMYEKVQQVAICPTHQCLELCQVIPISWLHCCTGQLNTIRGISVQNHWLCSTGAGVSWSTTSEREDGSLFLSRELTEMCAIVLGTRQTGA